MNRLPLIKTGQQALASRTPLHGKATSSKDQFQGLLDARKVNVPPSAAPDIGVVGRDDYAVKAARAEGLDLPLVAVARFANTLSEHADEGYKRPKDFEEPELRPEVSSTSLGFLKTSEQQAICLDPSPMSSPGHYKGAKSQLTEDGRNFAMIENRAMLNDPDHLLASLQDHSSVSGGAAAEIYDGTQIPKADYDIANGAPVLVADKVGPAIARSVQGQVAPGMEKIHIAANASEDVQYLEPNFSTAVMLANLEQGVVAGNAGPPERSQRQGKQVSDDDSSGINSTPLIEDVVDRTQIATAYAQPTVLTEQLYFGRWSGQTTSLAAANDPETAAQEDKPHTPLALLFPAVAKPERSAAPIDVAGPSLPHSGLKPAGLGGIQEPGTIELAIAPDQLSSPVRSDFKNGGVGTEMPADRTAVGVLARIAPALSQPQTDVSDIGAQVDINPVVQMTANAQVMLSQIDKLAMELAQPPSEVIDREEATVTIDQRMKSVRIKLQPESLGDVLVNVRSGQDGLLIDIRLQNDEAGRRLLPDIDSVTRALSGMGLAIDQFILSTSGGAMTVVQSSAERGGNPPSHSQGTPFRDKSLGEDESRQHAKPAIEMERKKIPEGQGIYI